MKSRTALYARQYKWSNIFAMMRNSGLDPVECTEDFGQKLVVITGATSGIGYAAARKFASRGADLVCVNRNPEKSEALRRELEGEFGIHCRYVIADLSRLGDILKAGRELALMEAPINVLIHNAGVYRTRRELTPEGLETTLVVHYLSSFILNYLLMDKLKAQGQARILMVGSEGHRFAVWGLRLDDLNWERRKYSGLKSYGSAKLAQMLSMLVFDERLRGTGVTINTMHPGAVKTETGQENGWFYRWFKRNLFDKTLKSPDISAEALYYLGVSKELEGVSGKFFNLTTLEEPAPPALDREVAYELWEKTLKITGIQERDQGVSAPNISSLDTTLGHI